MTLLLILILCLLPAPLLATDRYYDFTLGLDANPGTEAEPFKTIDQANSDLNKAACGDRFFFKRGETWTANDTSDNIELINKTCTTSTKIVIDAYGAGALPIINGVSQNANTGITGAGLYLERVRFVEVKNILFRDWNTNILSGARDILIDGIEIDGTGKEGFRIKRHTATPNILSERITIQNSTFHEAGQISNGECIYIGIDPASNGGVEDRSNNITITGNTVHTCNPEAIEAKGGVWNLILERNVVHTVDAADNTSGAILINRSTELVHTNAIVRYNYVHTVTNGIDGNCILLRAEGIVHNNILANCVDAGVRTEDATPDGYARLVYNNTIYSNDGACHTIAGTGAAQRNNICWQNGSGNDGADPLFINAAGGDFGLQATSPRINDGASCDTVFNGASCDDGAHETLVLASAEVGLVDTTTVVLTFTNNLYPPLLPASACTGFTVEEDTGGGFVAATVSACARSGTNQVRLTLSAGITALSTVRFSYSTGTGNVTDSALIGNTKNQRLNAISNSAIVNNVEGAAPTHVFDQKTFQFYSVRTSGGLLVKLPHAAAALDTNVKTVPGGGIILGMQVDGTVADPPPIGVLVYYQKNGAGGYAETPGSFGADNIRIGTSQTGSDVPVAGEVISTCLSGALTVVDGQQVTSTNAVPTFNLTQDDCIVIRWTIEFDTDVTAGDYYELRLYNQDTSALDTYTVTPRIDIISDRAGGGT
jgi:hypothetical protein